MEITTPFTALYTQAHNI